MKTLKYKPGVDLRLDMVNLRVYSDGKHNSNTNLVYWQDQFWLIHANSKFHFFSGSCKLLLHRSKDGAQWTFVRDFEIPGVDIRDPKLSVIGDSLFLYAYKSAGVDPMPYMTTVASSKDGVTWTELVDLTEQEGWLLWTPKTMDGKTWYASSHKIGAGQAVLYATEDGRSFRKVSTIYQDPTPEKEEGVDETDFAFFEDGRMVSTQRLEYRVRLFGNSKSATNLTLAEPPYTQWTVLGQDRTTRLDGPALFSVGNRVYAAGRYNPYAPGLFHQHTSLFAKKRTALFLVTEKGLVYLSDLPSTGDTSYCGTVVMGDAVYISYYTSNIKRDYPWILGMLLPSEIRVSRISLSSLEPLAKSRIREYEETGAYCLLT